MEKKIVNYPEYVNIERTEIILKQMQNCICKIYKGEGQSGTGFFCCIPYENRELKVLITNFHVIDEKYIKEKNIINVEIFQEQFRTIHIENDRKIYLSPDNKNDLAIIEIKEKDNIQDDNFLKLDDKLFIENPETFYESNNSIYIIQYPNKACVSYGILKSINKDNNEINHLCCTNEGSSGSPILSLESMKVIGIHRASNKTFNYNLGIFLNNPIKQIKNEMKIIGEIKKNYIEINNKEKNDHNIANVNNDNFIKELLKNNLISKEELEQNLNEKIFENNRNAYSKKHKEELNEGLLVNCGWNKNEYKLEQYIEDGIYNIIPKHFNNRAIDISCADIENMANLQLYEFNNSKAQQFEVKYNSKYKYHTIKCLCSNKFLSVDIKNNYNIVQYEEKNQIDQQWHIVFKDNSYIIISEVKGYLMNVDGSKDDLGTNIYCQERVDKDKFKLNQQFQFEIPPTPEGIKYFKKPLFHGEYNNKNSLVDGLKSIGENSSLEYRALIASINGIQEYKVDNNIKENLEMVDLLKQGKLKKP